MRSAQPNDPMPSERPIRVMMLGLRGCPDVQGGVERHVERLAPLLQRMGCDVEIVARTPYVRQSAPYTWQGMRVTPLACPTQRSLEAAVHTLRGVLYAARVRPDILHIHAVGPSLLVPLARLLGLRVVVTHHGYDYERAKWGRFAKVMLRLGEFCGMRFANARIAVSRAIAGKMQAAHGGIVEAIPNGVDTAAVPSTSGALASFGLEPRRYVLAVGRLVPEKRHLDLIAAFPRAGLAGWKLALVGAADHPDAYSQSVEQAARATPGVVMTGFQKGLALEELYANAGLFVLPSTHEGLPISLLEALAYGLPCIASDIEANLEVGLPQADYFPATDVAALADRIVHRAGSGLTAQERAARREKVLREFDWSAIAQRTVAVYRKALARAPQDVPVG